MLDMMSTMMDQAAGLAELAVLMSPKPTLGEELTACGLATAGAIVMFGSGCAFGNAWSPSWQVKHARERYASAMRANTLLKKENWAYARKYGSLEDE